MREYHDEQAQFRPSASERGCIILVDKANKSRSVSCRPDLDRCFAQPPRIVGDALQPNRSSLRADLRANFRILINVQTPPAATN